MPKEHINPFLDCKLFLKTKSKKILVRVFLIIKSYHCHTCLYFYSGMRTLVSRLVKDLGSNMTSLYGLIYDVMLITKDNKQIGRNNTFPNWSLEENSQLGISGEYYKCLRECFVDGSEISEEVIGKNPCRPFLIYAAAILES